MKKDSQKTRITRTKGGELETIEMKPGKAEKGGEKNKQVVKEHKTDFCLFASDRDDLDIVGPFG